MPEPVGSSMGPRMSQEERYTFDDFRLEANQRRLLRGDTAVELPPKAFDLLLVLVRRAGELIGRDELIAALWPGTVISENSLGRQVWLLRKALGQDGNKEPYIQTVSKQGYRFVAVVRRISAEAEAEVRTAPPVEPAAAVPVPAISSLPPARPPAARWPWLIAACVVALVAIGGFLLLRGTPSSKSTPALSTATAPVKRVSVALFDIAPADQTPGDAWRAASLSELLGYELGLNTRLHVVAGRRLTQLVPNPDRLEPGRIGSGRIEPGPVELERLRQTLGIQFAIFGRYRTTQGPAGDRLQLDLRIVDTATGREVDTSSIAGDRPHVSELIAAAGTQLSRALDVDRRDDSIAPLRGATTTDDAQTLKAYAEGVQALRRGDSRLARVRLSTAVARSPAFLPAQLELARTLQTQGYEARAAEIARAALVHAAGAPRELQLALEATMYEGQRVWPDAIRTYRMLYQLYPDEIEYGLDLAHAQSRGDSRGAALATIEDIKRRHGDDDPRIHLRASWLMENRGDLPAARTAAEQALRKARALQAPHLIGQALIAHAWNYQAASATAVAEFEEARTIFRKLGDPIWEARADNQMGGYYYDRGDFVRATAVYRRALVLFESAGIKDGQAAALSNLANIAWAQEKPEEVKTTLESLLQLARELSDPDRETWTLSALATVQADTGLTAAALAGYQQAWALAKLNGLDDQRVRALSELGNLQRLRGEYVQARNLVEEALELTRTLKLEKLESEALMRLGQIALDSGETDAAAKSLADALVIARRGQLDYNTAAIESELARAALLAQRTSEVLERAQRAAPVFEANDAQADLAAVNALRALAQLALRQPAAARTAMDAALVYTRASPNSLDVFPVLMAEAQVLAAEGHRDEASVKLAALIQNAKRRDFGGVVAQAERLRLQIGTTSAPENR